MCSIHWDRKALCSSAARGWQNLTTAQDITAGTLQELCITAALHAYYQYWPQPACIRTDPDAAACKGACLIACIICLQAAGIHHPCTMLQHSIDAMAPSHACTTQSSCWRGAHTAPPFFCDLTTSCVRTACPCNHAVPQPHTAHTLVSHHQPTRPAHMLTPPPAQLAAPAGAPCAGTPAASSPHLAPAP